MENYLESGGVLPSGLLSGNDMHARISGFNKTYRNYPLRCGVITKIYAFDDPDNDTNLSTEYDVQVFEQNEDRGYTVITYQKCISSDPLGGIADFFEKNLRNQTVNTNPSGNQDTANQNGTVVLLLCLDAVSEKAIIVGGLNHPDRNTTLLNTDPYLEGEYNGVNMKVNTDGSAVLTFNGATDRDGIPIDTTQGVTTFQIKKDGSYEFKHDSVDISADRSGALTITTKTDCNINAQGNLIANCVDATIIATGTATIEGEHVKLGANAEQSIIKGDLFKTYLDSQFMVETVFGPSGQSIIPVPASNLSDKSKTE